MTESDNTEEQLHTKVTATLLQAGEIVKAIEDLHSITCLLEKVQTTSEHEETRANVLALHESLNVYLSGVVREGLTECT